MYEGINGYLFHFNYMHLFTTFFQHSIYGGEGEEGFSICTQIPRTGGCVGGEGDLLYRIAVEVGVVPDGKMELKREQS